MNAISRDEYTEDQNYNTQEIEELQEKVENLEGDVTELKEMVNDLEDEVEDLQAQRIDTAEFFEIRNGELFIRGRIEE